MYVGSIETHGVKSMRVNIDDGSITIEMKSWQVVSQTSDYTVCFVRFNGTQSATTVYSPIQVQLKSTTDQIGLQSDIRGLTFQPFRIECSASVSNKMRGQKTILCVDLDVPSVISDRSFATFTFPSQLIGQHIEIDTSVITVGLSRSPDVVITKLIDGIVIKSLSWGRIFTLASSKICFNTINPTDSLSLDGVEVVLRSMDNSILGVGRSLSIVNYTKSSVTITKASILKTDDPNTSFHIIFNISTTEVLPRALSLSLWSPHTNILLKNMSEYKGCLQVNGILVPSVVCKSVSVGGTSKISIESPLEYLDSMISSSLSFELIISHIDFDSQTIRSDIDLHIDLSSSTGLVMDTPVYSLPPYCTYGCISCYKKDNASCTECVEGYKRDEFKCIMIQKYYKTYIASRILLPVLVSVGLLAATVVMHRSRESSIVFTVLKMTTSSANTVLIVSSVVVSVFGETYIMMGWIIMSTVIIYVCNVVVYCMLKKSGAGR